jgi:hypothetical protein
MLLHPFMALGLLLLLLLLPAAPDSRLPWQ